jgi:hypothetical protein
MSITTFNTNDSGATIKTGLNSNFSALNTDKIETSVLDTDGTLAADSDSKVATQKATKTYVDTTTAAVVAAADSYSNYLMSTTEYAVMWTSDVAGAYGQMAASFAQIRYMDRTTAIQAFTITTTWATATACYNIAVYGNYLYALMVDAGAAQRLYRYDKNDLSAGGTLMTISGQAFGTTTPTNRFTMDSSGNFYFTAQAGGSASLHIISKYSLSGTTLTFVSNTTCGSTSSDAETLLKVDASGNIYLKNYSSGLATKKFNSSGTLVKTYPTLVGEVASCIAGEVYFRKQGGGGEIYQRIEL